MFPGNETISCETAKREDTGIRRISIIEKNSNVKIRASQGRRKKKMTMTITQQIITVAVVVLGTMTTRFLPFLIFPEGKEPPAVITYLGTVLPYAVIGLLVVYCLKDVPGSGHYGIPELIAILFIVALHKWKKSTLLSIGGGTVLYMVLVQTIFG